MLVCVPERCRGWKTKWTKFFVVIWCCFVIKTDHLIVSWCYFRVESSTLWQICMTHSQQHTLTDTQSETRMITARTTYWVHHITQQTLIYTHISTRTSILSNQYTSSCSAYSPVMSSADISYGTLMESRLIHFNHMKPFQRWWKTCPHCSTTEVYFTGKQHFKPLNQFYFWYLAWGKVWGGGGWENNRKDDDWLELSLKALQVDKGNHLKK